jgi:hypothetical protein
LSPAAVAVAAAASSTTLCLLAEAVLQQMWQDQPDADAAALPMPYSGLLRELFATDVYFEVAQVGSGASSSGSNSSGGGVCVGLRVSKIKEMLNW